MIRNIRHIIFDLGGVLLNIDYALTENAFREAGIGNFGAIYSQLQQTPVFDEFETGKIDEETFIMAMQQAAGCPITKEQIIAAWNAMLLDFPLRRLQILQQLRNYHDLFLLSNTNIIHETAFNNILMQEHRLPGLGVFFDRVYLSHRIGLRKPTKEIFSRVLEENGLLPEHTLFIDDSRQHIEGAKTLGIQTIFLEKGMTIEEHVFKPKTTAL